MNERVIEQMNKYFAAGAELDIDVFDKLYHPSFENVRMDTKGNIVTITKEQFMSRLRQLKVSNQPFPPASNDDIAFLDTNEYGPYCSLLLKRTKEGMPVLYNFVWQNTEGNW